LTIPNPTVPRDLTTWQWLFEHPTYSPIARFPPNELAGYTNALTKERLNWLQVKEAATHLSTALKKRYGLQEGDTVALFSQNSIWYPVAMHATLRVGGKVSGASPAYNVEEMTYALKTADAKFLMTHPNSMEVAVKAAENAGIPRERVFLLEGEIGGHTTIKELIEMGRKEGEQSPCYTIPEGKTNFDICEYREWGVLQGDSQLTSITRRFLVFQLGNDRSAKSCKCIPTLTASAQQLTP